MAIEKFLRASIFLSISAFVLMFVAFASPYWYKSWTRVHSPFGNIGLWHVCLNGFIMPKDPVMKSYVGCWWIHSTEFDAIKNDLQPVWFRFIQAFCIFSLVMDLFGAIFTVLYKFDEARSRLYQKRPKMFFINAALMLGSAFLVFLIALVFAEMTNDSGWMPRPWMNYLSWSYGLCVLSGFCACFAGMCLFILGLIFKDKEDRGEAGVTSAADLARQRRELEKQDEAMRSHAMTEQYPQSVPVQRSNQSLQQGYQRSNQSLQHGYQVKPHQPAYHAGFRGDRPDGGRRKGPPSDAGSQASTRVGESFV